MRKNEVYHSSGAHFGPSTDFVKTLKSTIKQFANEYSADYLEEFLQKLPEDWTRGIEIYLFKRTPKLKMYSQEDQLDIIEQELLTGKKKQ